MKAALAVWEDRISPLFDVSRRVQIVTVESGVVKGRSTESIAAPTSAFKVERLVGLGVDTLVCGAISEPLRSELAARGVTVHGFVAGTVNDVVRALVAGTLPNTALSMPGAAVAKPRVGERRGQARAQLGRSGKESVAGPPADRAMTQARANVSGPLTGSARRGHRRRQASD